MIGAAIGLYFGADDEKKAEVMDEIKSRAEDAKKSIGKVVKQSLEELDKAVDVVKQAAQDTISKIGTKSEIEAETA